MNHATKESDELWVKITTLPVDYRKELSDFLDYLLYKAKQRETLYLSEKSLSKDWLLPEEEKAWQDL